MEISATAWGLSLGFVALLIVVDLLLNRKPSEVTLGGAAWATAIWTAIGLLFGVFVLYHFGGTASGEYYAGYLLERMLSIDNVFVFVLILTYFAVPSRLQHRALLFGVIAALLLRAIFIFAGVSLLEKFEWMTYAFGALLLVTAIKLMTSGDEESMDPDKNLALRAMRKVLPVSSKYEEHKLFTKIDGKRAVTPLMVVLLVIGTSDLVFAIDSIPAIFAVTRESYLIFTSNAFALLGLRPMSFLLAQVMDRFAYLKHALVLILALVAIKMLVSHYYHVNVWVSLGVIAVILFGGISFSLLATRNQETESSTEPDVGTSSILEEES